MTDFTAPIDDILFSLRHVAQADSTPDWDDEMSGDILTHFANFATDVLAPINAVGHEQGAKLIDGRVQMPDGFGAAYKELAEAGWQGLSAPDQFDGMIGHPLLACAVSEVFSGANHSMQMVCNLVPGAISTLMQFGSDTQKQNWVPRLASGELLSTMCLTEAGAGSDLSAIRCKAVQHGDTWKIEGEKIFISGGDQDMSDGILHLVLARTGAPDSGIKGLSLFLCPSDVDGQRNTISVTRIEEKMGLHASPTCQMAFDGADAELIGELGSGLRQMFTLMNHARLDVSLQGVAAASRAFDIANAHANERKQGRKPDGTPAVLADHADVRRMLDEQRTLALGARAMCHVAMTEALKNKRPAVVDLLTSLCKVFGTEAGIHAADLGIQVLGGYGYLEEYGLAQVWADARITAIYEGANGIHKATLATRALRADGAVSGFVDMIGELADGDTNVVEMLDRWKNASAKVLKSDDPLPMAHAFYELTGDVMFHAVWVRLANASADTPMVGEYQRLAATLNADVFN